MNHTQLQSRSGIRQKYPVMKSETVETEKSRSRRNSFWFPLIFLFAFLGSGCASNQYKYGIADCHTPIRSPQDSSTVVVIDGTYPKLDKLENVVQAIPRFVEKKVQQLNRLRGVEENQREVDPATQKLESIRLTEEYLAANGIGGVRLEVRRYDPAEQWKRLKANDEISPVFKYTVGLGNLAAYTLLPNRVFQTNQYNPYTKTMSLNSFEPGEVLLDIANIKQYHKQQFKGAYSALQYAPVAPLVHQAMTSSDALTYAKINQPHLERGMYPTVYSNMASSSVSQALSLAMPAQKGQNNSFVEPVASTIAGAVGGFIGEAVAPKEKQDSEMLPPTNDLTTKSR